MREKYQTQETFVGAKKSARFLLLTIIGNDPIKSDALPQEELSCSARAYVLPVKEFLTPQWLSVEEFESFLYNPKREYAHSWFSLALWNTQKRIALSLQEQLSTSIPVAQLPPIAPKVIESYFEPSGRYWMSVFIKGSAHGIESNVDELIQKMWDHKALGTSSKTMPWIPELSKGGAWALGASQIFGTEIELLGLKNLKKSKFKSEDLRK